MKMDSSSSLDANNGEVLKKKERHVVSWSQEEDDVLREQIRLHGSENWGIIASKFKDKTTRQCRRRWLTYLNSDFKKGGWSPEEDKLLCEAQRIYGNRWTEIAKVVSGRTDNAVKNRFTTLCKKRAKGNSSTTNVNSNNKRVVFSNGLNSSGNDLKKKRTCTSTVNENCGGNLQSCEAKLPSQKHIDGIEEDSTLNFLKKTKENQVLMITNEDTDCQVQMLKDLGLSSSGEEDIRSCVEGSSSSLRDLDIYESSPTSSLYSTSSTLASNVLHDRQEECREEFAVLRQETGDVLQEEKLDVSEENGIRHVGRTRTDEVKKISTDEDMKANNEDGCDYVSTNFCSPTQVTPLFRAMAATIPSPKFSESEKHFLMKTLGLESTSPAPITNPSQPPPCKRSLLHRL